MPAMTSSCRLTSLRWMSGGTVWNHRLPEKACEQIGQVRQRRQRQPRRVTKTPLRCFRSRHPARNVMPATPCIDHQHNRLAAMRPPPDLSDRLTGQWMESIVNRDLETHNVGFVWVPTSRTARRMSRTSRWLARVCQFGLGRPSLVPDKEFRALRGLSRYRRGLIQERSRTVSRG